MHNPASRGRYLLAKVIELETDSAPSLTVGLLPCSPTLAVCPVAAAPGSDKSASHQLIRDGVGVEDLVQDFHHAADVDGD
jgi:hypothetical protein